MGKVKVPEKYNIGTRGVSHAVIIADIPEKIDTLIDCVTEMIGTTDHRSLGDDDPKKEKACHTCSYRTACKPWAGCNAGNGWMQWKLNPMHQLILIEGKEITDEEIQLIIDHRVKMADDLIKIEHICSGTGKTMPGSAADCERCF